MDGTYGHLKHWICCVSPLSRVGVVGTVLGGGAVVSAEAVGGLVVSIGGGGVFGGLVGGAVSVGSVGKKRSEAYTQ